MRLLLAIGAFSVAALAQPPLRVLLVIGGPDRDIGFYSVFDDARFRVSVDGHQTAGLPPKD
jgi:hypothetical protein